MSKKLKFIILLSILSIILSLLAGEIFVRLFKAPLYPRDSELGWIFPHKELKGTGKYKILVIGDSFTQARGLREGKAYYDYLLPLAAELKVYGIGAYGSFQEYLLLNRVLQTFSADIILWQFCPNDFINNVPELERQFHSSLHAIDRPFLMSDGSSKFGRQIYSDLRLVHLLSFSRLFLFLYQEWHLAHLPKVDLSPEEAIKRSEAINVTGRIFKMLRESLLGKRRLYLFTTETSVPLKDEFNRLVQNNGQVLIPVAERLLLEKSNGQKILGDDQYHWNELGHRLVAEEILSVLNKPGI